MYAFNMLAPSRPSKNPERRRAYETSNDALARSTSPTPSSAPFALHSLSQTPKGPGVQKPRTLQANGKPPPPNGAKGPVVGSALGHMGHIRETLPMPFILQPPEEQTDNWDDDFEEGISLTKLQGK